MYWLNSYFCIKTLLLLLVYYTLRSFRIITMIIILCIFILGCISTDCDCKIIKSLEQWICDYCSMGETINLMYSLNFSLSLVLMPVIYFFLKFCYVKDLKRTQRSVEHQYYVYSMVYCFVLYVLRRIQPSRDLSNKELRLKSCSWSKF